MKNIGKISIVMPCYRSENYVADMIGDILNQTYSNWELIIVSNGKGSNAQLEVIHSFSDNDDRIRVFSVDEPGVSNARNIGMKMATGTWLTFVDADDRLTETHISSLIKGVADNIDIIIGGYTEHIVNENIDHKIQAPKITGLDRNFIEMFDMIKKTPWAKLFRISALREWDGSFDTNLTISEDAVFCYSFYCFSQRIVSIPISGYIYNFGNPESALSKYHDCCEYAEGLLLEFEKKMISIVDADDGWKIEKFNNAIYSSAYFTICNFFKGKDVSSYKALNKRIKEVIHNPELKRVIKVLKSSRNNINFRIFNYCVLNDAPLILYVIFTSKKLWKKFRLRV